MSMIMEDEREWKRDGGRLRQRWQREQERTWVILKTPFTSAPPGRHRLQSIFTNPAASPKSHNISLITLLWVVSHSVRSLDAAAATTLGLSVTDFLRDGDPCVVTLEHRHLFCQCFLIFCFLPYFCFSFVNHLLSSTSSQPVVSLPLLLQQWAIVTLTSLPLLWQVSFVPCGPIHQSDW